MRMVIHRAVDKLDPTAARGECIDHKHLMDLVAGQAIGRWHHHAVNGRQRGAIAEAIKPWALQGGPAIAVIAVDRFLGDMPVGAGHDIVM